MSGPEMLRPAQAATRFNVSRQTLIEWADRGLIGRSRVKGVTFYLASDIAELIASNLTPRSVLPIAAAIDTVPADDWRSGPLWSKAR